jgi:hypothetical protein
VVFINLSNRPSTAVTVTSRWFSKMNSISSSC